MKENNRDGSRGPICNNCGGYGFTSLMSGGHQPCQFCNESGVGEVLIPAEEPEALPYTILDTHAGTRRIDDETVINIDVARVRMPIGDTFVDEDFEYPVPPTSEELLDPIIRKRIEELSN